ncbi:hypothetical protein LMG33810_002758 [Carnimonas sp. LMG 33810]
MTLWGRLLLGTTLIACSSMAVAETDNQPGKTQSQSGEAETPAENCHAWDKLAPRHSINSMMQRPCQTLFPSMGGFRQVLAEHGWGIEGLISGDYSYDIRGHNRHPRTYNGQSPTYKPRTAWNLTYDLTRLGWGGDAQFIVGGVWQGGQYKEVRPNYAAMSTFAVNQRFFDGQLSLQYGYYTLLNEYYGSVLGGNSATAAQGPSATLPTQVGLTQFEAVPAVTITGRDPSKHWYNEFTVARSGSPKGYIQGLDDNPTGFKLKVSGARAMFVDEAGFKRPSAPHQRGLWARVGGIYNTSHYRKWKGGESSNNYGIYAGYTAQLTQPDHISRRGWYVDAKSTYIPQDRNIYGGDIQLTTFYIGPFASRPYDMASLGASRSFFNKDGRHLLEDNDIGAEHSSTGITASYAANVFRGFYLNNALTYQTQPAFTPKQADALIYQLVAILSF